MGALRGLLRGAVGCAHQEYLQLTTAERSRCGQRLADEARGAPVLDTTDPSKRAAYEREGAAGTLRRARAEGSMEDLIVPCEGRFSNLGVGCLPPRSGHGFRLH